MGGRVSAGIIIDDRGRLRQPSANPKLLVASLRRRERTGVEAAMRTSFLDSVLRGAEALAGRNGVGTLADPDLLRRFAADRDEAAFAVLVRRHGPLVWG